MLTLVLSVGFRAHYYKAFVFVALITLLALDIDLLTGATMIKSSVLGYDPMAGARYYGVGNEYMGVMIGCAILVSAAIYQAWHHRWVLWLLGIFLALSLLPQLQEFGPTRWVLQLRQLFCNFTLWNIRISVPILQYYR